MQRYISYKLNGKTHTVHPCYGALKRDHDFSEDDALSVVMAKDVPEAATDIKICEPGDTVGAPAASSIWSRFFGRKP